ncbi:complement factor H-like isoform X1 [Platichthys flesus]|uniref:complement factor H-like isoform X1 n=1 Tax=Platichthys flesus TaxID=8260 RepID=UPI002DBB9789|nr:complement factor H-like isoform X1 [Platichthys flesus]
MHVITRSCVLLFWMQTLTLVKSLEPLPDCTLQDFLNGPLFDSNFNTTGLEARYVGGKQITVSCRTGYSGFFQLLCIEGEWQSRGTKCQPKMCPVIHVSTNVQVIGDPEEANIGNVVQFSCKANSDVLIGLQGIYCNEKGEWSGEAPICKGITCLVPVIENGRVPGDVEEYKEHDILRFQCNPGFQPSDDRPSKCTKLGLRAGWNPTPECEPITCKLQLPPLDGTEYDPSYKSVFSLGDTVTVRCAESHWISDKLQRSTVVSCKMDGQWSLSPVCQEVTCSNQKDPLVHSWDVYWGQQKKLGDEVVYGCKSGYRRTGGATMATCTREGWKPDPLCHAPLDCQQPPPLENGDTKNSVRFSYRHNERVEHICQAYHVMQGGPFKTCSDGEWTGEIRCLRPCTVDEEAMRGRNLMLRYSGKNKMYAAHDDWIMFVCSTGRPVGSVGMRQKCVDGVLQLPLCQ